MATRRTWHRWFLLLPLISCSAHPVQPVRPGDATPMPVSSTPAGASVSTRVEVPARMRSAPFNVDRYLRVPPNFDIAVYARIPGARFMAVAPNDDLLVSQPTSGKVLLVRPGAQGTPIVSEFVTGLRKPHDLAFHTIGGTTYLYVAETHQINRYVYTLGDRIARGRQVVITGLPDHSTTGLKYGHQLKNIAIDPGDKL